MNELELFVIGIQTSNFKRKKRRLEQFGLPIIHPNSFQSAL